MIKRIFFLFEKGKGLFHITSVSCSFSPPFCTLILVQIFVLFPFSFFGFSFNYYLSVVILWHWSNLMLLFCCWTIFLTYIILEQQKSCELSLKVSNQWQLPEVGQFKQTFMGIVFYKKLTTIKMIDILSLYL